MKPATGQDNGSGVIKAPSAQPSFCLGSLSGEAGFAGDDSAPRLQGEQKCQQMESGDGKICHNSSSAFQGRPLSQLASAMA